MSEENPQEIDSDIEESKADIAEKEAENRAPGLSGASQEDVSNIIMSLVFASQEVLTIKKIRQVMGDFVDTRMVREAVRSANEKLNGINAPFEVVEQAGGFRFRTRKKYSQWVRTLFNPETQVRKLSQAALETLAIIAYKQPITKAEIEAVRGVSSDGPVKNLLDRKMVALGGRAETLGNPYQYVTTKEFLKYFGINRIPEDLPRLHELNDLIHSNELVPQFKDGQLIIPTREEQDPNQLEMPMAD